MMNFRFAVLLPLLLLPGSAAQAAKVSSGADKVLACMRANLPQSLRVTQVELVTRNGKVVMRTLKGRLYLQDSKDELRTTLRLSAPPQMAGAAYLFLHRKSQPSQVYLYFPATRKVRRITGTSAGTMLFGTAISYGEVSQLENAYSGGNVTLEKPTHLQGRPVQVLMIGAKAGQPGQYRKMRVWVDRATCVALKMQAYQDGKAVKKMTVPASSLKRVDGHWLATKMRLRDLSRGTQTDISISGVSGGKGISASVFNPESFYTGAD